MGIKRIGISIADKFSNKLDDKMITYVSKYVSDDMSTLEKAISIYLALGDVLCYSPYFSLTHDFNKISMVRDINLNNNEMICKSWAILYYRLLKHFGIKARIHRSTAHYKVEMILDGVIYSMDATGYGGNHYFYTLSDTTRIKCNLRISGFLVSGTVDVRDKNKFAEGYEKLNESINNVYKRHGRNVVPDEKYDSLKYKVGRLVKEHAMVVGIGSEDDINYRIKVINRFWGLNIIQTPVEKVQLFNAFYKFIFDDFTTFEFQSKCYNVFAYKNHKLVIYKLLVLEVNGIYYYYLDDGKKFTYYTRDDLLKEFMKRNVRITEFTEIMGLYGYADMNKIKMK